MSAITAVVAQNTTGVKEIIADRLRFYGAKNIVVDPVMVATSGDRLISEGAVDILKNRLLPVATAATPNIPEAEILSGMEIQNRADIQTAAKHIGDAYGYAVLLKGGHDINDANDYFYNRSRGECGQLSAAAVL